MDFLRRRLSDSGFTSNLSNGFLGEPPPKADSPTSRSPGSSATASSFLGSLRRSAAGLLGDTAGTGGHGARLLVIAEPGTEDWPKLLRGKKVMGDTEIHVEQASFSELGLVGSPGRPPLITIRPSNDTPPRSYTPDLVLLRQCVRDGTGRDYRPFVLALAYAGIPSVNSLESALQFGERAWVLAQLSGLRRSLGEETFPFVPQIFHVRPNEMGMNSSFPTILKPGHTHGGLGKVRANNLQQLGELTGALMLAGGHGTSEPCLDAKYSLLMSKVGSSYKAFVQTALPGHWKALPGEMVRKQVAMTDRYQTWVDLCAQLFGGLDICAIKVLHSSNGSNYIIDVMDSTMPLLGESPTEEQQLIADLVLARLERVLSHPQAVDTGVQLASPSLRDPQPPGQSCLEYILDCNGSQKQRGEERPGNIAARFKENGVTVASSQPQPTGRPAPPKTLSSEQKKKTPQEMVTRSRSQSQTQLENRPIEVEAAARWHPAGAQSQRKVTQVKTAVETVGQRAEEQQSGAPKRDPRDAGMIGAEMSSRVESQEKLKQKGDKEVLHEKLEKLKSCTEKQESNFGEMSSICQRTPMQGRPQPRQQQQLPQRPSTDPNRLFEQQSSQDNWQKSQETMGFNSSQSICQGEPQAENVSSMSTFGTGKSEPHSNHPEMPLEPSSTSTHPIVQRGSPAVCSTSNQSAQPPLRPQSVAARCWPPPPRTMEVAQSESIGSGESKLEDKRQKSENTAEQQRKGIGEIDTTENVGNMTDGFSSSKNASNQADHSFGRRLAGDGQGVVDSTVKKASDRLLTGQECQEPQRSGQKPPLLPKPDLSGQKVPGGSGGPGSPGGRPPIQPKSQRLARLPSEPTKLPPRQPPPRQTSAQQTLPSEQQPDKHKVPSSHMQPEKPRAAPRHLPPRQMSAQQDVPQEHMQEPPMIPSVQMMPQRQISETQVVPSGQMKDFQRATLGKMVEPNKLPLGNTSVSQGFPQGQRQTAEPRPSPRHLADQQRSPAARPGSPEQMQLEQIEQPLEKVFKHSIEQEVIGQQSREVQKIGEESKLDQNLQSQIESEPQEQLKNYNKREVVHSSSVNRGDDSRRHTTGSRGSATNTPPVPENPTGGETLRSFKKSFASFFLE